MRTAVVTGATGCVGRNIVEALLSKKDWKVLVLHRKSSDLSRLKGCDVSFREVDLYDVQSVRDAIPSDAVVIFHAAANTSYWSADAREQWKDNVLATLNLLDAAKEKKIRRFIFTSTAATSLCDDLVGEELEKFPSGYIRSKQVAERAVLKSGLDAVVLRPCAITGRHDWNGYSKMFRFLKRSWFKLSFPGGMEFCHAEAVAEAHLAAYERGRIGQIYYLFGDGFYSWFHVSKKMTWFLDVSRPWRPFPVWVYRWMARWMVWISCLTRRKPLLTPELVFLLNQQENRCQKEEIQSEVDLGYIPAPLFNCLRDCYGWMVEEGLL